MNPGAEMSAAGFSMRGWTARVTALRANCPGPALLTRSVGALTRRGHRLAFSFSPLDASRRGQLSSPDLEPSRQGNGASASIGGSSPAGVPSGLPTSIAAHPGKFVMGKAYPIIFLKCCSVLLTAIQDYKCAA